MLGKLVKKGSKLFCVAETDAQLDVSKLARLCEFKSSDLASLLNISERQMERSFHEGDFFCCFYLLFLFLQVLRAGSGRPYYYFY